MSAAEAREGGDATDDQRAELRDLIDTKAVTGEWVQQFYDDVQAAGGLAHGRANLALEYLRGLADKTNQPTYATPEQGDELRGLIRTRIVPVALSRLWLKMLDAGQLTYVRAEQTIRDYQRMPKRHFVAPQAPRPGTPDAEVPDGYYAVAGVDGRVRCYRIHTKNGGGRAVDLFTGGDDKPGQRRRLHPFRASDVIRQVAAAGPAAGGALFAAARKRCCDCNQPLHDEHQPGWPHGVGPDCWDKRQDAAAAAIQPTLTEASQ